MCWHFMHAPRVQAWLCSTFHTLHVGEGTQAFCSGGDQSVRGEGGYVGPDSIPRLNVLDLQAS